ncbi:MAG: hypothetical protein ACXAEE_00220 [Candidatus Thorarchaeota archaeon]|jgi:succinate dehydrogenase/fumarate reductase cytochrome b subunit
MVSRRVFIHRYISWWLLLISLLTVVMGYALARGWIPDQPLLSYAHRVFEIIFIGLLTIHVALTVRHFGLDLGKTLRHLRHRNGKSVHVLRLVQRVSSWLIVVFAILMIIPGLNGYEFFAQSLENVVPFDLHRVFDVFLVSFIIVHAGVGVRFVLMRRRVRKCLANGIVLGLMLSLLAMTIYLEVGDSLVISNPDLNPTNPKYPEPLQLYEEVLDFNPADVETVRPDIFKPGAFSMFDILVHMNTTGLLNLEYHFNESMNTHVIDSVNGLENIWYTVTYDGGWIENNVFRMDHYPWKEGATLRLTQISQERIEKVYSTFREEVDRLQMNDGYVVIPEVSFIGRSFIETFTNVNVTAHDLRSDIFQDGVITGIDVILSLTDQGLITSELQWYESMGFADIVRSYWVDSIMNDTSVGTCGWVYDSGSLEFRGFAGNHIHLPSDARVLNSPDYTQWFWICI